MLEDSSKNLIRSQDSFQKVCDLIHNQLMASYRVQKKFDSAHMLEHSQARVKSLLQFMHAEESFRQFFIDDLLKRARNTVVLMKNREEDYLFRRWIFAEEKLQLLEPETLMFLG